MEWLWELDRSIFRTIHLDWHRSWLDPFLWVISTTGLGHVQGPLILLLTSWQRLFNKSAQKNPYQSWFWPVVAGFAISGLFNQLVFKQNVHRERPSNFAWANPQEGFLYDSFASGHTVSSFGIAFTLLFLAWGRKEVKWAWLAVLWATLVGFSRIYRGVHWPTDVIAAILQALFWAALISWFVSGRPEVDEKEP